ncbi:MAG: hypothetical protein DCC65_14595 [Planctomycetota bacterium]|nr:MAG: hypothetical protein DCC65_14595 [Planctomycetota bacterium]
MLTDRLPYAGAVLALAGLTPLFAASGCMRNLHATLPAEEIQPFRQQAVTYLGRAALSDQPVQRMQALEAFQDVDPKDGAAYFSENLDNGYAGVCFAALMAAGTVREAALTQRIRTRAEDADPNVRIAAVFALHRLGDKTRTGELGELLLKHPDARVRANAALAIGRLAEPQSIKLLQMALRREKKDAVVMQILEALAMLGDNHGIERLRLYGYSAVPDQAALALMFLANARPAGPEVEELFRYRLDIADHPEIKLQAARGLGRLGYDSGLELSLSYLTFNAPDRNRPNDPPEQQIIRIRALAALALEAIGDPRALGPLKTAFDREDQPELVKIAIARAAIRIIDGGGRGSLFGRPTYQAALDDR